MSKNYSSNCPGLYSSPVCNVTPISAGYPILIGSFGEQGEAGAIRDVVVVDEEF